ncbi:MAG: hypothetical protein HRJ53_07010, partial [Acidobacteria bacterium Pan2503]|nr:hypothetical protein [Candidatus Acidoferrum panamensis]
MRDTKMKKVISNTHLLLALMLAATLFLAPATFAATPGISGPIFNLTAQDAYLNQPDGEAVYSWGYGCATAPPASAFLPQINGAPMPGAACPTMQVPGPTLIVTEGTQVTI